MMKARKVEDEGGDSLECHLDEGRLYVYVGRLGGRGGGRYCEKSYLGASFTAAEIPALRKWAKALLKMCDDKSMEVE